MATFAARGDGLFRDDTRVLSHFRLLIGDRPPSLLGASLSQDNVVFTANLTNLPLTTRGRQADAAGRHPHRALAAAVGGPACTSASRLSNYGEHETVGAR